jgi:hypothetical protein
VTGTKAGKLSFLENATRNRWIGWGDYAGFYVCAVCDEFKPCRSKHGDRWLCLGCFDQEAEVR